MSALGQKRTTLSKRWQVLPTSWLRSDDDSLLLIEGRFKFILQRGHKTFGKFAPPSLGVAIEPHDLFLDVFHQSLPDQPRKLRRSPNANNGARRQTGAFMCGVEDAPRRAPRQSERRSLLLQCHKPCFNKSRPDFSNLGALSHLRF